jgi:murein tripeptide amidase MpaA
VAWNRNWNDHWGGEGSSGTPTSDTYRGTAPFSEPETAAVSQYVFANAPFNGAIDYHSYSQLILRPYGWTTILPPNDATAKLVGDTIRARILAVNNVPYTSQASWQLYYTAGTSQDWYYSQASIPLSYTIELRDTGTYGFQLPAAQIKPTGTENWAGFLYFAQSV